jgi:Protein of unknown function (DUF2490)
LIVFISGTLRAQQNDFVLLTGMSVTKNINRAWDLSLATQLNFNQNVHELWFGFADASIGYKLRRNLNSEFHMREIQYRQPDNSYRARRLFYHTLTWSKGIGKWSFSVRNRLQQLIYGEHFSDDFKGPLWYNRDRIAVRYRINYYWAPYASAECMLPLNRPTRSGIDQYRVALGMSYTANDYVRVDSYYQIQHQLQRSAGNNTYFVLGLNLSIKIP